MVGAGPRVIVGTSLNPCGGGSPWRDFPAKACRGDLTLSLAQQAAGGRTSVSATEIGEVYARPKGPKKVSNLKGCPGVSSICSGGRNWLQGRDFGPGDWQQAVNVRTKGAKNRVVVKQCAGSGLAGRDGLILTLTGVSRQCECCRNLDCLGGTGPISLSPIASSESPFLPHRRC